MFLSSKFEGSVLPRILAPLLAGLLMAAAYHNGAQAAPKADAQPIYVISDHEGYGVVECLTKKRDCGKIVADSWCEAHGHGPARAYGPAEDITATVGAGGLRPLPKASAAIVTCEE